MKSKTLRVGLMDSVVLSLFRPVRVGLIEPPPNRELRSEDAGETAGAMVMKLGTVVDKAEG
jgi:hypothetical protein